MAGAEADQQWPPRSPFEALLSSPSGRSRIRRYQDRTSPSPSPLKAARSTKTQSQSHPRVRAPASTSEEEDEEDEETLQLRLQALEAKLKLKRLQQKNKVKNTSTGSDIENERPANSSASSGTTTRSAAGERDWQKPEQPLSTARARRPVQVPVSPQRTVATKEAPHSPGRVLLGIDKGLKGKHVSLRRAPETKCRDALDDPFLEHASQYKHTMQRSNQHGSKIHEDETRSRPMTFSEKIADSRQRDKEQQEKERRLQGQRSTGFGIGQEKLDSLKNTAAEANARATSSSQQTSVNPAFSREEVLKAASRPNGGLLDRGISNSANQSLRRQKEFKNPNAPPEVTMPAKEPTKECSSSPKPKKPKSSATTKPATTDPSLFEPFSSVHLSKRLIPHDSLTQAFSGKSILLLPNVLASVKAPDYCFPDDLPADIVILAIIASKSTPLAHKDQHKTTPSSTSASEPKTSLAEAAESAANQRGKYMALTLTDLKWTVDLYLFASAFTRFWKLIPGTLVAVLNPSIMPPPPHNPHNNRFSLTLNANDDTILELGKSRDLGWCTAVRKDGKPCEAWIDKRHTSVCEFHVNLVVDKARRGRMDLNGINTGFAPGGKKSSRSGFWGGGNGSVKSQAYPGGGAWPGGYSAPRGGPESGARYHHRPSQTTCFVGGRSAASSLLDGDHLADRAGREERMRKRLAEREREREIARQLGEMGQGMGGEYLKTVRRRREDDDDDGPTEKGDGDGSAAAAAREPVVKDAAASLGLKRNYAGEVQLGPVGGEKRKKKKRRKTTRFVTERGIKVAGRESLGVGGGVGGEEEHGRDDDDDDDDDDDLDIV